jgi:hypothetical protein
VNRTPLLAHLVGAAGALCFAIHSQAQPFAIPAFTTPCGGATTPIAAGRYTLQSSFGSPLRGAPVAAGSYTLAAGVLALSENGPPPCYANCDHSTAPPILNVNDFVCFLNKYAVGDAYANCDGSTLPPVLNVNDFVCFLNAYAAGCH